MTRKSSRPITVTLEALDTRIFQVEDFESLIFTNATNENGGVSIFVEKHSVFAVIAQTTLAINITAK